MPVVHSPDESWFFWDYDSWIPSTSPVKLQGVHLFLGLKSWRFCTTQWTNPCCLEETKHYQHLVNPMLSWGDLFQSWRRITWYEWFMPEFLELSFFQTAMSSEFGVWVGINKIRSLLHRSCFLRCTLTSSTPFAFHTVTCKEHTMYNIIGNFTLQHQIQMFLPGDSCDSSGRHSI